MTCVRSTGRKLVSLEIGFGRQKSTRFGHGIDNMIYGREYQDGSTCFDGMGKATQLGIDETTVFGLLRRTSRLDRNLVAHLWGLSTCESRLWT